MSSDAFSHVAYSDESRFNVGQYRSVAVLTCPRESIEPLNATINQILAEGQVKEFKWYKLHQARERFVAIRLIDLAIQAAKEGLIRLDVLVWDTHDSRHLLRNRDDLENLHRMYYHLLRNVLRLRWPNTSIWKLLPDEHTSMNWVELAEILRVVSSRMSRELSRNASGEERYVLSLSQEFGIHSITPIQSHTEPLCQLTDLFAGLGAYSYEAYEHYSQWVDQQSPQLRLEFEPVAPVELSNREAERFRVMHHLSTNCKRNTLGVGLISSGGLRTYDPSNPINFWRYVPQSRDDKAPTKDSADA